MTYHPVYPDQFLGLPPNDLEACGAVILPLPLERTVSYGTGTWRAPRAMIDASCQVETFDEQLEVDFEEAPRIFTAPAVLDDPEQPLEDYLERISCQVQAYRGKFVLALGGEHTVTYGTVKGLKQNVGDLTVLQIDAHADLIDKLDGHKFSHGTVMRRLGDEGLNILQVGVRSLSRSEYDLAAKDQHVTTFFAYDLAERWPLLIETLRALEGNVYLTVDVDGMDPSVFPSTGTPQPDGLSWRQLMTIIETVACSKQCRLVGADIVELVASPHPPGCDLTAAKLATKILAFWSAGQRKGS